MFKIYYLKFTQYAIDNLPKAKRVINEHYVFSFNINFFVMTSKPVSGLKSTFIHTFNIEGQSNRSQYVIEHTHVFDPKYHVFEQSSKGDSYLAEHKQKFVEVMDSIKNLFEA